MSELEITRYSQKGKKHVNIFTVDLPIQNNEVNIYNPKKELINDALKYHSNGNFLQAIKCYQLCLEKGYNDPIVFLNYGAICNEIGEIYKAESLYQKAIKLFPNSPDAYINLAIIYKNSIKLEEAELLIKKAIELDPYSANAYNNMGNLLRDLGKIKEAEKFIRKAIELKPDYAKAYNNLGAILREVYKYKEAEFYIRKSIELDPDYANAHNNLGATLRDLCKLEEAESITIKAIQLKPNFSNAFSNLGLIYKAKLNLLKAENYIRKAIQIDFNNAEAHLNLAIIFLTRKKFTEGWKEYEWRWKAINKKSSTIGVKLSTTRPEWNPSKKGTVLLWGEQGLGDEILFSTLIPDFIDKVDKLIVKTDKRLIPLFKRTFDSKVEFKIHDNQINETEYDSHIAMGSLPKFLRPSLESFQKAKKLKLKVDQNKATAIRSKLIDSKFKKVVGISWKSTSKIANNKSLTLEEFMLGIYSPNIRFVCLQYGDVKEEIQKVKEKHGIDICELEEVDKFNDIDHLAALISACDQVVSVSNVTVHLAGAIGIPSKILVPTNNLFYLGKEDRYSYWHPSLKLFRQRKLEGWEEQLAKIKEEITII